MSVKILTLILGNKEGQMKVCQCVVPKLKLPTEGEANSEKENQFCDFCRGFLPWIGKLGHRKVAVFPLLGTKLVAYLKVYNPHWPGCCIHYVPGSSYDAKKTAMREHRSLCGGGVKDNEGDVV